MLLEDAGPDVGRREFVAFGPALAEAAGEVAGTHFGVVWKWHFDEYM